MTATRHPFDSAPLGTPALEVCATCGQETGSVLLKTRGRVGGPDYTGPRHVATQDSRCEFCHFLEIWCASEGHDPKTMGRCGAAKIVERVTVRDRECLECKHRWTSPVRYGATPNISGELTEWCPECNARAATGSPHRTEEKLVAFVPFTEHEDLDKCLADGTPFTFAHGMVIRAERDGETGFRLVAILKPGV